MTRRQLQRLVPLSRQLDFDDLVVVIKLNANQWANRMHVLDAGRQAFIQRMMGNIDVVWPDKSRDFFSHFTAALNLGIAAMNATMKDIDVAEELINEG